MHEPMAKTPEQQREYNADRARLYTWRSKLRPPDGRRTIPVRLTEIPLDLRLDAARAVCAIEAPADRPAILAAALFPSDDIHWVAA